MHENFNIFAENFKSSPFWWERSPRPAMSSAVLPASADVLIIGSGYTGLSAALQTARAGLDTVVVDAEALGWGCSTRNGGQISTSIKPDFATLSKRFGPARALAIMGEGHRALDWLDEFIASNGIKCDFRRAGRFYAAHNRGAFEQLKRRLANQPAQLETGAYLVEPGDQHQEIVSRFYHGGAVFPRHAALDPGRYHQGLLQLAMAAGVKLVDHCRVDDLLEAPDITTALTVKGELRARDVIIATNGYTGRVTPWLAKRIIPIGSYVIATEPLPAGLAAELIPNDRVITDTRRLVVYYRTCPERKRIIFGGRVSLRETDPRKSAPALHREMVRRFPALSGVKVSHSWMGFVGFTFDDLPHLGQAAKRAYYAMGYCGSGVSLASYFGMRIGQQLAGDRGAATALDSTAFPTRFYYSGNPWFLAPAVSYYRWLDERNPAG